MCHKLVFLLAPRNTFHRVKGVGKESEGHTRKSQQKTPRKIAVDLRACQSAPLHHKFSLRDLWSLW